MKKIVKKELEKFLVSFLIINEKLVLFSLLIIIYNYMVSYNTTLWFNILNILSIISIKIYN